MKHIVSLSLILVPSAFFATTARAQTGTITQLFSFACPNTQVGVCPDGSRPNALIQASDGNFYGAAQVTIVGSSNPQGGTLFKLTRDGQFTRLFTFTANASGLYVNGDNPASGLLEANDGFLYGTTGDGGAQNQGVLFRIGKDGKDFSVVHDFCSAANCADGSGPGGLTLGHDGNLYGTTGISLETGMDTCQSMGGCGTIFRFTPPGTFTTLHQLNGTTDGEGPSGIIQGSDGDFFGTISNGVFRFASGGQFTVLATFPLFKFLPTISDGGLFQASNGKLYGPLLRVAEDEAQFFEIDTSGSGFQELPQFGTLASDFAIGNTVQASDGNLWTALVEVGTAPGSIIAMSPANGAVVQNFSLNGANGSLPEAGVIQGADGKIYGTAALGGTLSNGKTPVGTIWSLDAGLPAPSPAAAAFNPASGAVGSTVLIRGNNFIGTTAVAFNGVGATFQVLNVNFIRATVPSGAPTGPITVTNAGGTTESPTNFTVE
jgi:uncharacterized repeat protein (TIGR03803 family)